MDKFDGQIIVTADQHLNCDESLSVRLATDNEMTDVDTQTLNLLEAAYVKNRSIIDQIKFEGVYAEMFPDIAEILSSGKLKMAILLSTDGGKVKLADKVINAARHIRNNGGLVDAYVPVSTASSGTMMMQEADNIYVVGDAYVGWHLSSYAQHASSVEKAEEMSRMKDFVERRSYPEFSKISLAHFEKAENDPDNVDNSVVLRGKDLGNYGIAEDVFYSAYRMKSQFEHEYPFVSEEADEVSAFWETEIWLEDFVRQKFDYNRHKIDDLDTFRELVRNLVQRNSGMK